MCHIHKDQFKMSGTCSGCQAPCIFKEKTGVLFGFPCDVCRVILCKDCGGLSSTEVRFVAMASRGVPYLCKDCIGSLKLVSTLKTKIDELEHEIQELKIAAESSKSSYADILKKNTAQSEEIKGNMKNLEERVESVTKPGTHPSVEGALPLEPAVQELQERERRAANILLFGVKESSAATREARIEQESKTVEGILQKIDADVAKEVKVTRLGRYDEQKVRPIKVTFPTKSDALSVLKKKSKLGDEGSVYIKSDQTVCQRKYLKTVIAELENRTKQGEQDLKIRYISNVPRIVKLRTATVTQKN